MFNKLLFNRQCKYKQNTLPTNVNSINCKQHWQQCLINNIELVNCYSFITSLWIWNTSAWNFSTSWLVILRCFSFLLGGGGGGRTGVTLAGTGNESGINICSCNKEGGIGRISSSESSANGSIVASRAVEAVETHEFLLSSSEKKRKVSVFTTQISISQTFNAKTEIPRI